jgi:hypothetical protein
MRRRKGTLPLIARRIVINTVTPETVKMKRKK